MELCWESEKVGREPDLGLVLLCALATEHGIDLESSVRQKFFEHDAERHWKSAP